MYFKNSIQILKTLTFKRLINLLKVFSSMIISFIRKKPVVWGKPYTLFIEPTGWCNLKCPECVVGSGLLTRGKGHMSLNDFRQIIDDVQDHVMIVYLYFQGEPFLNNEIYEMIRYAVSKKIYVVTSTNGHFFQHKNQVEALVKSGIQFVIISLDGVTQESYEKYRKGGKLSRVESGIQNVTRWKRKLKSSFPKLALQFLVMRDNEHEIPELRKKAKKWGVNQVLLKSVQVYHTDQMESILPKNEKYRRYEKRDGQWKLKGNYYNFCTKLWVGSVISWDSRFFVCCFDKDGHYSPGDIKDRSFDQVWKDKKLKVFRKEVLTNRFKIDICRNCSEGQKIFF